MEWSFKPASQNREWLETVSKEYGVEVPALENEHALYRHLHWVWSFFLDLNKFRKFRQEGPEPLSYAEIESLAALRGMCHNADIEDLLYYIPAMDQKYLELAHESMKKDRKSQGSGIHVPRKSGGAKRGRR